MLGKDLLIASGGRVIAAQRTCNINVTQNTIETCSPVSGPWQEHVPSTLGWEISCAGLIYAPEYADELIEVLTSRQKVRISYYDPELRCVRSGYAIPTGLQEGANIGSLATYSLNFKGSGELEKVEPDEMGGDPTWQFADIAIDGYDETHRFVELPVDGVKVWRISISEQTRLNVSQLRRATQTRPFFILCKMKRDYSMSEEIQLRGIVEDARDHGMLRFYAENEVAHSKPGTLKQGYLPETMDVLLNAGDYYVITTEEASPIITLLSLPTT